jgi:hypothetical protein
MDSRSFISRGAGDINHDDLGAIGANTPQKRFGKGTSPAGPDRRPHLPLQPAWFLLPWRLSFKAGPPQDAGVAAVFCDVDNLKQINDSFGHQAGDLTLILAAAALEQSFAMRMSLPALGEMNLWL